MYDIKNMIVRYKVWYKDSSFFFYKIHFNATFKKYIWIIH